MLAPLKYREERGEKETLKLNKRNRNSNNTHFICFTMVLLPDSPAPVNKKINSFFYLLQKKTITSVSH